MFCPVYHKFNPFSRQKTRRAVRHIFIGRSIMRIDPAVRILATVGFGVYDEPGVSAYRQDGRM